VPPTRVCAPGPGCVPPDQGVCPRTLLGALLDQHPCYRLALLLSLCAPFPPLQSYPFAADNRLVQRLQSSVCPYHMHAFPKIAPSPKGSSPPHNTLLLGPNPLIIPNGISNGLAVFVWRGAQMLCCTMHCQCGSKPQNCPYPSGFRYPTGGGPSHSYRQHEQKFG